MENAEEMFLFDSYCGWYSYWIKEDYSGYYELTFGVIKVTAFEWSEIENPLSLLENSAIASDRRDAAEAREKIKPYYQKAESAPTIQGVCFSNREA